MKYRTSFMTGSSHSRDDKDPMSNLIPIEFEAVSIENAEKIISNFEIQLKEMIKKYLQDNGVIFLDSTWNWADHCIDELQYFDCNKNHWKFVYPNEVALFANLKQFSSDTNKSEKTIRRYINRGLPVIITGKNKYIINRSKGLAWIQEHINKHTEIDELEYNPHRLINYLKKLKPFNLVIKNKLKDLLTE